MKKIKSITLIVSMDVHKSNHRVHFEIKETQEIIGHDFTFTNDYAGFSLLFTEVDSRAKRTHSNIIAFVMEPTGHFWKSLGYAIEQKGYPLYFVSPEQVFHQRIADKPGASKDDFKDPITIAKLFRDNKVFKARLFKGVSRQLNKLNRERISLSRKLSKEKIQLRALIQELNPELLSFFSNPLGKISKAVLQYCPAPEQICSLGINKLTQLFKTYGNNIIGRKKAEKLLNLMKNSISVKDSNSSHLLVLKYQLKRIDFYQKQINQITLELIHIFKSEYPEQLHNITTIPGIESIIAAGIVAEIGDIKTIQSPKALVSMAGIHVKDWISGSSIHKKSHISKKGNPFLRTLIFRAALSCIRNNLQLKSFYEHLLSKEKKRIPAVIAVARKLLTIIYHILKNNQEYNPDLVGTGLTNKSMDWSTPLSSLGQSI